MISRGYLLFEVNSKYILSSVLKTSDFLQVRSMGKMAMFSTHEMTYLVFTVKKVNFLFISYFRRFMVIN